MISTKGRYALRVMLDLAEHGNEGYIPLKDIAKRQAISDKYLESILKSLVKQKMLKGLRGKVGDTSLPAHRQNIVSERFWKWPKERLLLWLVLWMMRKIVQERTSAGRFLCGRSLIHWFTISFTILLWNRFWRIQSFYQKNKFLYRWRQIFAMMIGYMNRILEREIGEGNLG